MNFWNGKQPPPPADFWSPRWRGAIRATDASRKRCVSVCIVFPRRGSPSTPCSATEPAVATALTDTMNNPCGRRMNGTQSLPRSNIDNFQSLGVVKLRGVRPCSQLTPIFLPRFRPVLSAWAHQGNLSGHFRVPQAYSLVGINRGTSWGLAQLYARVRVFVTLTL